MRFTRIVLTLLIVAFPGLVSSEGMTFEGKGNGGTCYGGCYWIEAQGEILPSTPEKAAIALEMNGIPDLVFNSEGGDKAAGIELGRIIRKEAKNTLIGTSSLSYGSKYLFEQTGPGACRGACAIAFLGGKNTNVGGLGWDADVDASAILEFEPLLDAKNLAGFKSGSTTGEARLSDQRLIGAFVKYLLDMGISPRLYETISRLTPGTTLQLDNESLAAFKLQEESRYPDGWKLKLLGSGLAMQFHNVRLFCKGSPENMHLQLVYEEIAPEAPADDPAICNDYACMSVDMLEHHKDELYFWFGDARLPAQYNGAYQSPSEALPLIFDFLAQVDVVERLKTSKTIDVSFPTERRPELMALFELENPLPETLDQRFLALLKQNCL